MLQTKVNQFLAKGVEGDYADDSPRREAGYILVGTSSTSAKVGVAYTQSTTGDEYAVVGGTGNFLGICVNSKIYANYNGLTAGLDLPDGIQGGLCSFGHIYVKSATAFAPGYIAAFNQTTGEISAYASSSSIGTGETQIANAKFIKYSGDAGEVGVLELGN